MSDCIWVGANVFGKRAEVFNAIHAMAVVSVDDGRHPIFVGAGNLGFAPFGDGPNFSQQIEEGLFRLHLLKPISITFPNAFVGKGEGIVLAMPLGQIEPSEALAALNLIPPRIDVSMLGVSDIVVTTLFSLESPVAGAQAFKRFEGNAQAPSSFIELMSVEINMVPDAVDTLEILATASAECDLDGTSVIFRLTLDGQPVGAAASYTAKVLEGGAGHGTISLLDRVEKVTPGKHMVGLEWRTDSSDALASIHVGIQEGASLLVKQLPKEETEQKGDLTFQVIVFRFPPQPSPR